MDSNSRHERQVLPDTAKCEPASASSSNLRPLSEEKSKKLEALRRAVADGSYEVSASDLADKLIDSMLGRCC